VSLWRDPNVRQFVRFAIVGVAQNGTNLAVFALFLALGIPFLLAAAIAAVIALALSFALNRTWTFPGTGDRTTGRAARFAAVWLAFVAVALPTLALLVDVAHLPRVPAQALIIFVGAPLSYLIQRHWTFRPADAAPDEAHRPADAAPDEPPTIQTADPARVRTVERPPAR
jgi:dolichol-phosphate mannosyltransferase